MNTLRHVSQYFQSTPLDPWGVIPGFVAALTACGIHAVYERITVWRTVREIRRNWANK